MKIYAIAKKKLSQRFYKIFLRLTLIDSIVVFTGVCSELYALVCSRVYCTFQIFILLLLEAIRKIYQLEINVTESIQTSFEIETFRLTS